MGILSTEMSGPDGLRLVANWMDVSPRFADMSGSDVQNDLRRWADDMETAVSSIADASRYESALRRIARRSYFSKRRELRAIALKALK